MGAGTLPAGRSSSCRHSPRASSATVMQIPWRGEKGRGGGGGIYRGAKKKFFALGVCVEGGRVRSLVRVHGGVLVF